MNSQILATIIVVVTLASLAIATVTLPHGPETQPQETTGKPEHKDPVEIVVTYRVAPPSLVEKVRKAVEDMAGHSSSSYDRFLEAMERDGWVLLEVNATVYNNGDKPLVITTAGPACSMLGNRQSLPIDMLPDLQIYRGEAIMEPITCTLAAVPIKLSPGESYTTPYYVVVTEDFQGTFNVTVEIGEDLGRGKAYTGGVYISLGLGVPGLPG